MSLPTSSLVERER